MVTAKTVFFFFSFWVLCTETVVSVFHHREIRLRMDFSSKSNPARDLGCWERIYKAVKFLL